MPELRMPSINQVALSGRITQDPPAMQTKTGQFQIAFSVAVDRPYRDAKGTWQKETTTVPVCASDKLAELIAERLVQGNAVFITGRLKSRETGLEVVARHIQFLDQEEKTEKEHELCNTENLPSDPVGSAASP